MHTTAIVTASDGVSLGQREDASGEALATMITDAGLEVSVRLTIPDERPAIASTLRRLADEDGVDLVVITGGTGFGPRDVTPEATGDVIDRPTPGLAEAMRAVGRASTPMADLSRATAGIRGATLIVNVPGSPRGATESLGAILQVLPHALQLLSGETDTHPKGHGDTPDQPRDGATDAACDLAHGAGEVDRDWRLVTIGASPVARALLHWGRELGYRTELVEPDASRITAGHRRDADRIAGTVDEIGVDGTCDVVATDHGVADLADHLSAALGSEARWIGLMGSPRHTPPHIEALRARGFSDAQIARIERPIGLDLGSHTPAEIALATLAGLLADRNGRKVTITRS